LKRDVFLTFIKLQILKPVTNKIGCLFLTAYLKLFFEILI